MQHGLKIAQEFADLMDNNRYTEAALVMSPACRYFFRGSVLEGVPNIIQSYVSNFESAKNQLDEIQFFSEVVPEGVGVFRLKYLDRLRKGSDWFEHRCEQTITIEESRVSEIRHFDLPGEPEKLNVWFSEKGIKRR